jgi:hypothetical protein
VSRAPKARARAVADGNGVNSPQPAERDEELSVVRAYWIVRAGRVLPGKSAGTKTVPETDTGGLVEYTEALERTVLKELGKLPP